MKTVAIFLQLICGSALLVHAQGDYYYPKPNSEWAVKAPFDLGISQQQFQKAIDFAKSSPNTETKDLRRPY